MRFTRCFYYYFTSQVSIRCTDGLHNTAAATYYYYYYLGIWLVRYYIIIVAIPRRSQSFPDIIVIYLISNKIHRAPDVLFRPYNIILL